MPVPKLKEGSPTRVILRDLKIFNPVESINQRKRLPEMDKIGGDVPSTKWKGNSMECTWTIQTKSMTNGLNETIGIDKPTKSAGPRLQGIVKNKL